MSLPAVKPAGFFIAENKKRDHHALTTVRFSHSDFEAQNLRKLKVITRIMKRITINIRFSDIEN